MNTGATSRRFHAIVGDSEAEIQRAVADRNANTARALRSLAERESLNLNVLELDVTDNASVERAVEVVIAQSDRIDVLINNAGYALFGLAEACTLEQAQRIFDTNFFGVVRMNRAVLPHMRRRRSGLLVQTWFGDGPELSGLRMLGLFDRPADEKALGALVKPPAIRGLTKSLTDLSRPSGARFSPS